VDSRGRRLAECGDAHGAVFTRSTAKPFQAMPLLLAGGEKAYRLGDPEIALMCASHGGEPRHAALAGKLLRRGGFRVADLQCGAHLPMHGPSARELIRRSEAPSPLHHNCSGNHAGILLACRLLGLDTASYCDPAHPLQRRIRSLLAFYADVPESAITTAVDGCNLPVFRLPLAAVAAAYARLLADKLPGEDRLAPPRARDRARDAEEPGDGRRDAAVHDGLHRRRPRALDREGGRGGRLRRRACAATAAARRPSAWRSRSRTGPRDRGTP
jgi:L-asparaginase II